MSEPERRDNERWRVSATERMYGSSWVEVWLDDVELPGGEHIRHHVVKFPRPSVGAVAVDGDRTLLIWRHRYITDTWGWEIPAGWAEPGEDLAEAARREVEEETGHRPARMAQLLEYKPMAGISTMHYTLFVATDLAWVGPATEKTEGSTVEWIRLTDVPRLAAEGSITDGPSITALSYFLTR